MAAGQQCPVPLHRGRSDQRRAGQGAVGKGGGSASPSRSADTRGAGPRGGAARGSSASAAAHHDHCAVGLLVHSAAHARVDARPSECLAGGSRSCGGAAAVDQAEEGGGGGGGGSSRPGHRRRARGEVSDVGAARGRPAGHGDVAGGQQGRREGAQHVHARLRTLSFGAPCGAAVLHGAEQVVEDGVRGPGGRRTVGYAGARRRRQVPDVPVLRL